MYKFKIIIISNCIISLVIGLMIYLTMKPDTVVSQFLSQFIAFPYVYHNGVISKIIYNWACDFLWAYSMIFALYFVFNGKDNINIMSLLVVFISGCFIEILQLFNVLNGTFDFADIIAEVLGIVFANIIIKKVRLGYEKNKRI